MDTRTNQMYYIYLFFLAFGHYAFHFVRIGFQLFSPQHTLGQGTKLKET